MNKLFLLLCLLPVAISCHRNPLNVNTSNIRLSLQAKRLDQDISTITASNIQQKRVELEKKYGPFFDLYNKEILAIGSSQDSLYPKYLLTFLHDTTLAAGRAKCATVFHDFRPYEQQFEEAFKHYRYYYPSASIPVIYTLVSGFNQSIITTPGLIGISLDDYLGADFPDYKKLGIYEYKRRNMEPQKLVYDALWGWISQHFEYKGNTENLVTNMIHQGKLLYFMDALIPDGSDTLKIGYSQNQLTWCHEHEKEMWNYLIERKMLFSGDRMELVRFINPAPFTTPFGQKSPGRTGVWIGWQIVKSYMLQNPKITVQSLMEENDYHQLLNESGYSPE